MRFANAVATWATVLSIAIGGGMWVGSIASEVENNKTAIKRSDDQLDKLRNDGPPAIARLEEKTNALQRDVNDIKDSQSEILREIRKK